MLLSTEKSFLGNNIDSGFFICQGLRHCFWVIRCLESTGGNFSHRRRRENTLVSWSKNQKRIGQSHSRPRTLHRDKTWAVSNGSMGTLKNSSWFEFENTDSRERRRWSWSKNLQKLGWITSVSCQTDKARHHDHSQHSVLALESTYQSTLAMWKTTLVTSSNFKNLFTQKS